MEALSRAIPSFDWITLVIFLSLVFLAISKRFFYTRFQNFLILPFNNKYIFMYNKKALLLNGFQIFFTLFQVFNFALLIYLASSVLMKTDADQSPTTFLLILGAILLFMILKVMLQMGNGYVFNNTRVISDFIFKKLSYLNYSGMIMAVSNIILSYIYPHSRAVVFIAILLVLLINAVGWITLIKNHQKLITSYFFYFILYLCALEIAPLVLIVNALTF